MSNDEFVIREKVRYREEWDWEGTKSWMKNARDACLKHFKLQREDYRKYNKNALYALEESIAVHIFGITIGLAKKAHKDETLLQNYSEKERNTARDLRIAMEQISGEMEDIEMQIVPILARMESDLKSKEETEKKKERNKNTGKIFVFRIKDPDGNPVFLDCQLRTYKTWEKFLTENKIPTCIYCFPAGGFLRKEIGNEDYKNTAPNSVEFGESPSCWIAEAGEEMAHVYSCPSIAINSFHCPASWFWTARTLAAASAGYSYFRKRPNKLDDCSDASDHLSLLVKTIMDIEALMLSESLRKYVRTKFKERCPLTTLENIVITGFMLRLTPNQVASFSWMTWILASKPCLKPKDIICYAVAIHNLYSCIISPWNAARLLRKVHKQIKSDYKKNLKRHHEELDKKRKKLEEHNRELEELKKNGGDPVKIEKLEGEIIRRQSMVRELEGRVLEVQNTFLDNKGKWMRDSGARNCYKKFRENTMEDAERRGADTVYENGRITKAVTYMDAEMVFGVISMTGSTIQFSDVDSVLLLFNSQIDIHPRAVNQLFQTSRRTRAINQRSTDGQQATCKKSSYLKDMLVSTKAFDERTMSEDKYQTDIGGTLKDFEMICRFDIAKVKELIYWHTEDKFIRNRFEDMGPREAYRMRTVLKDAPVRSLDLAFKMAAAHDDLCICAMSINILAAWVEIIKLEVADIPKPEIPPESRKRWTEYHEYVKESEIAGLLKEGESPEQAEAIAGRNFQRNENKRHANEKRKNGENVDMFAINSLYRPECKKFHKESFPKWNENDAIKTSKDIYFIPLLDENNPVPFNEKMADLTKEIDEAYEIAKTERLTIKEPVEAYYHARKHANDSYNYFTQELDWNIPKEQKAQQYFKEQKLYIFMEHKRENKFISQGALYTSSIHRDKDYVGIGKRPYNGERGREFGKKTVATHYPEKRDRSRRPSARKNEKNASGFGRVIQSKVSGDPELVNNRQDKKGNSEQPAKNGTQLSATNELESTIDELINSNTI